MSKFLIALNITLQNEGGYSNNPDDPGGETYRGISRTYFPSWKGWPIIDKCKHDSNFPECLDKIDKLQILIVSFYNINFWCIMSGNCINNQDIANKLFDISVNIGSHKAIKFMQMAANLCCQPMEIDGIMGNCTIEALNECNKLQGHSEELLEEFKAEVARYYKSLGDPKYINGWLNRLYS